MLIPNYEHKCFFLGLPKLRLIVIAISLRDGNYDKPEFGQPQEETLMSIVWN